MRQPLFRLVLCAAFAAGSFFIAASPAHALSEKWTDAKGARFEAYPSDILGPWALLDNGTLVPLRALSDVDCVGFSEGLKDRPARADDWKLASSKIRSELFARLPKYKGNNLVADDLKGRPEPEFYVIFFASKDQTHSWDLLSRSTPALYAKLGGDFSGMVQGVVFGVNEEMSDHYNNATNTKGTWMFFGMVVTTRDGVPILGPNAVTDEQVKAPSKTLPVSYVA